MRPRFALALILVALPGVCRAQDAPERLLPADSQVYFRWDGLAGHEQEYAKTALAKMMKGDMGRFVNAVVAHIHKNIGTLLEQENVDAELAKTIRTETVEAGKAYQHVSKYGLLLGVAVRQIDPPDVLATLVFPKAGAPDGPYKAVVRWLAMVPNIVHKEEKVGGRDVHFYQIEMVHAALWLEGSDGVLAVGTRSPKDTVEAVAAKKPGLTASALFKEMEAFKEFPAWGRAFIDFAGLARPVRKHNEDVGKVIDALGLSNLKSLTFHSGFDGPAERGVYQMNMPGPRKGILALANTRKFTLNDLPPMPQDVMAFSASNLNPGVAYATLLNSVETVVQVVAPEQIELVKGGIGQIDKILGVRVREDLLDLLDDYQVQYTAPGDGILGLGQVTLLKVKDEGKLRKTLEGLAANLGAGIPGAPLSVYKSKYRNVELTQLQINTEGSIYTPTWAIHKGWLIVSLYPQPVQGFILRADGVLGAWRPEGKLKKTLDSLPQEFVGIAYSDPRPTLRLVLSILPAGVSVMNGFLAQHAPQAQFDVSQLPNADEVVRHLFPNVTITTDDGTRLRAETRASVALPY
jgi:hypothetical protein